MAIKIHLGFVVLLVLLHTTLLLPGDTIVKTPEGRSVPADTPSEMSSYYINYYNNLIDNYIRDPNGDGNYSDEICAIRIGNSSNTHNCHGYAWSISEGGSTVWIGTVSDPDVEVYYWSDGAWSNDGQPSYITASESEATHAWYTDGDHSVRKIQNSYPTAIVYRDFQVHYNVMLDYVSKWGYYGRYQHAKGHDIYKKGGTSGFLFKKLKTTHCGTLSNYPKTWIGAGGKTHSISGNILCPNNLTIKSGVTVNLINGSNRYSIISTGGTITKQSGATVNGLRATLRANGVLRGLCGTIQGAADYAGSSNEIGLQNGNFYEDVTIYNVYALRLDGASEDYNHFGHLNLINCDHFEGYDFGAERISVSNAGLAWLYRVGAWGTDQSTIGFWISNSEDVELEHCTASYSSAGVSSYSSEIDIPSSYLWDNNNGVQSYNGNDMSVNYTYFCGTALDLKAYNFSSIYTDQCYFDGGTPSISKSSECTVQTSSNLSCGSYKLSSSRQGENENYQFAVENDSTSGSGFEQINSEYFSLNRRLINVLKTKTTLNKEVLCNEYEKVIEDYKNFIAENPDSPLARKAVIYITRCLRRIDNFREDRNATGMRNFLTGIIENKKYPALKSSAERLMIDYYTEVKDYTSAIEISNNLIEKYKSDNDYACDVLYKKGLILLNNLKNYTEAVKCFITILQDYPESPIANLAENQLTQLGYNKNEIELEKTSSAVAKEYNISNSPNPFNPVTTIQYNLPEDINVVLEVFNIRGQKVKTLVNNFQSAGSHEVIFDGSNLGSGVYFYRFKAGNFNKVKRMLLVK